MNRLFSITATLFSAVFLALLVFACSESSMICAVGTHVEGGRCIPDISECSPGTVLDNGQCLPACGTDQYFNQQTETCESLPGCPTGTVFNPDSGFCEFTQTSCRTGSTLENGVCVPIPQRQGLGALALHDARRRAVGVAAYVQAILIAKVQGLKLV